MRVVNASIFRNLVAPIVAVLAASLLGTACDGGESGGAPSAAPGPVAAAHAAEPKDAHRGHDHGRRAPPIPAFAGFTIDGKKFEMREVIGKRTLLFLFNPNAREAGPAAEAVAAIAPARAEHNFQIVGFALASSPDDARRFAAEHGFDFPIVDDRGAVLPNKLGAPAPALVIISDAEGNLAGGLRPPGPDLPNAAQMVEGQLREQLRLPPPENSFVASLGERPTAPDFAAERLEGGNRLELGGLRGRPVVLIFFLHTCPHCHEALRFLKQELPKLPEATRPQLVGVSVDNRSDSVRMRLRDDNLDFFPVVMDADYAVRNAYGVMAGVPDLFVIDAQGSIVAHVQGWREDRDPPLLRMWLHKVAGQPVPMLLHSTGYSGNEFCGVCHEAQHETWHFTRHASAFSTLVKHGEESNRECVGCHVVGWEQTGGYTAAPPTPHLEDVGCETCHGRGGPHLSPQFVVDGNYEATCVACHDQKHSLGFDYATFVPRVSHAANAHLASLSLEERDELLAERGRPGGALLPQSAAFVGSEACRSCHEQEFETWSQSGHARAVASLEKKGEAGNAACLTCHTTGMGRPGGFPSGAKVSDHPDLAAVGCESCHGPGGDHVAEGAARVGTIVSLGDKCDSCVILQICGGCHDEANDPGFEFEVQQKIDAQRHGTIEPAATRGSGASAWLDAPPSAVVGALEHAFAAAEAHPGQR
ncbi:MAG: multiheme c-type cytochrome [Myxococcota bacterium]|nr:multiheme c-type cytochrome [Myxococcota bacterium]